MAKRDVGFSSRSGSTEPNLSGAPAPRVRRSAPAGRRLMGVAPYARPARLAWKASAHASQNHAAQNHAAQNHLAESRRAVSNHSARGRGSEDAVVAREAV